MATIATPRNTNENAFTPEFPRMALAVTPSDSNTFETPVNIYNSSDTAATLSVVPWGDEAGSPTAVTVKVGPYNYCPFAVRIVRDTGSDDGVSLIAVY